MDSRYEEYYFKEDIKLRLIAYQKCSTTTLTFLKAKWNEERYRNYVSEFKANKNVHKIVKIENDIEEIILEREVLQSL